MKGRPILTASEMAAAEKAVIDAGTSVQTLMERAGRAVADIALRIGGETRVLVLAGPGNNGGDGYVAARILAERGCSVELATLTPPKSDAAKLACGKWGGNPVALDDARHAPLVIDALFGTGLSRPLDEALSHRLRDLAAAAHHAIAIDLPSGVETDSGALLSPIPDYAATVALGALKPAHRLQPAAAKLGRVMLADIGIPAESKLSELSRPRLAPPGPEDHKYSRGYVFVIAGEMAGAALLAASAAMRSGAGYVALAGDESGEGPHALVHRAIDDDDAIVKLLDDDRINAIAIGPGLGADDLGRSRLDIVLASSKRLVLDADALNLIAKTGLGALGGCQAVPILTPHSGEFDRLFGKSEGSKIERARAAAVSANAVIVFKGPDTVIAAPDGRAAIAPPAPAWLASAGTGDVLTGIVAARYAALGDPFQAACAAVWLHAEAARRAGPYLIADDLLDVLPATLSSCL